MGRKATLVDLDQQASKIGRAALVLHQKVVAVPPADSRPTAGTRKRPTISPDSGRGVGRNWSRNPDLPCRTFWSSDARRWLNGRKTRHPPLDERYFSRVRRAHPAHAVPVQPSRSFSERGADSPPDDVTQRSTNGEKNQLRQQGS